MQHEVVNETAIAADSSNGSLNDPPLRRNDEFLLVSAADDRVLAFGAAGGADYRSTNPIFRSTARRRHVRATTAFLLRNTRGGPPPPSLRREVFVRSNDAVPLSSDCSTARHSPCGRLNSLPEELQPVRACTTAGPAACREAIP